MTDHTTHFYALGGPDFIIGPDAPATQRNMLGVLHKVGIEVGQKMIACRARNHEVIKTLGGRGVHPTGGLPGGWSKSITETERKEIETVSRQNIDFALFTLDLFDRIVLQNPTFLDLVTADVYVHETYGMGTVYGGNLTNFYDGSIRVIDPDGAELVKYLPRDYAKHIAERVEPWSYMKFPYLRTVGWHGLCGRQGERCVYRHPSLSSQCGGRYGNPSRSGALRGVLRILRFAQGRRPISTCTSSSGDPLGQADRVAVLGRADA